MTDVFISYSRRNLDFVQQLFDALKNGGKDPWFDQFKEPLSGIAAGALWWEQITYGIENADTFLIVASPHSIASPYCHAEIAYARLHAKRIVSVLYCGENGEANTWKAIGEAIEAIPTDTELPKSVTAVLNLKTLVRENWLELSDIQHIIFSDTTPLAQSMAQLIQALDLDLAWVKIYSQLRQASQLWEINNRSDAYLWSAKRLKPVYEMIRLRQPMLESLINDFLTRTKDSILIKSVFGAPSQDVQYKANIFTLMPFDEAMKPVYEDHLKNVAERLGLSIKRADDFFSKSSVMGDIWSGIFSAEVVIADCTGRNPNVFYELGIAHTLGKLTVMVTQNLKDIPFDLQQFRSIPYDFTPPGMQIFEEVTMQAIKNLRSSLKNKLVIVDEFTVEPTFGFPLSDTQYKGDVFMIMPFRKELEPVYENHVKPVLNSLDLSVKRGDDFFSTHSIMADIWAAIYAAKLVIVDCTGRNPNVFYELGIAHTLGKPALLITQEPIDIPYDVQSVRHILYEYTPRGMRKFEEEMREAIKKILSLSN